VHGPVEHQDTRAERIFVVVGIVVLAFNLRPAAVSVGPVLAEVTDELGMSSVTAGVLTTLPVLAFATFGAVAPAVAARLGVHRVTALSLFALVAGLGLRARTESSAAFLALSLLGLAGMAAANVLLPSLVKLHFPRRIGLLTSIYTTALALGLSLSSVLTVPISEAAGTWRVGLATWAVTALIAALPWLLLVRHDRTLDQATAAITLRQVARTRLGWAMAVFFGLQSMHAYAIFGWFAQVYRDAGFSATTAGLLLGVITAVSIPLSFYLPSLVARLHNPAPAITVLVLLYPVGYAGLVLAPVAGAWLWAVVIGTATATFPVALTLIGLRARTSAGTAALSGFTQSVGYLIAAVGPFGVGVLHDLTGGWTVPLVALAVLAVPQVAVGLVVSRRRFLEDATA
jgi:MFS transporter, CP family, cyanate transporter